MTIDELYQIKVDDYNEFKEDYQSDNEKLIEELREFYAEYEVLKLEVEQLRIELANMKK
jgi:predicted nuclease with TOPRIM domain